MKKADGFKTELRMAQQNFPLLLKVPYGTGPKGTKK